MITLQRRIEDVKYIPRDKFKSSRIQKCGDDKKKSESSLRAPQQAATLGYTTSVKKHDCKEDSWPENRSKQRPETWRQKNSISLIEYYALDGLSSDEVRILTTLISVL